MREGIFSDEDLNHLENGYSVSETDDERTHMQDGDIMSLRSGISGPAGAFHSALVGHSPGENQAADAANTDSNVPMTHLSQQRQSVNLQSEAALVRQGELEN